jgi:glycogen debranching enzyme
MALRGVTLKGLYPARQPAPWDRSPHPPASVATGRARATARLGWGVILAERREGALVVAVGAAMAEAEAALAVPVETILGECNAHVARCDQMADGDPVLRSMVMQGVHAALASIRADAAGAFAGLAAGQAYSVPARTYYRDSYWTAQALLTLAPGAVRAQIDVLAMGTQPDGEAPSGVILTGLAQSEAWERLRQSSKRAGAVNVRPRDWWSDLFDSPLFFVLLIADYVRATGDRTPAIQHWGLIRAVFERYQGLDQAGDSLPAKPRNDRDWADNVFRSGRVSYDLGLWIGVLDAIAELAKSHDPQLVAQARAAARAGRSAIDRALWDPRGWYADYAADDGFIEDRLSLDSLTLLRHDAATPQRATRVLESVRDRLETRANSDQKWGDWGVMCAWPPLRRRADVRAKSAFALRYHNGADWPWLDGLYAGERLRRGLPGWRYPLTRWWEICLQNGWMGAVEYYSPPFGRGSLLQGWSSLPAAVALAHRDAVLAGDPDA